MKNILLITSRADYGGGPEHMFRLMSRYSKNVQVFAACPDDFPYKKKFENIIGSSRIIIIPHRKFSFKSLLNLKNFIKKNKIDIVHSHGKGAGIYSRLLFPLTSVPVIHTFHGIHIDNYGKVLKVFYILLERFLNFFTKYFIAVSASEKQKAIELNFTAENKIAVISNGVVPQTIIRSGFPSTGKFTILTVTRYDFAKNTGLIILIIKELKKLNSLSKFNFHIVGEGEEKKSIEDYIYKNSLNEAVTFTGFTEDLSKFYKESFCYLSTSKWEGLPLSVLEAMSFGLPVIATNVNGNKDLVKNNFNGFLYEINNPNEAAENILKLAGDEQLWKELSAQAKNFIENNYSVDKMAAETEKLYFEL